MSESYNLRIDNYCLHEQDWPLLIQYLSLPRQQPLTSKYLLPSDLNDRSHWSSNSDHLLALTGEE